MLSLRFSPAHEIQSSRYALGRCFSAGAARLSTFDVLFIICLFHHLRVTTCRTQTHASGCQIPGSCLPEELNC